jgi:protease IV
MIQRGAPDDNEKTTFRQVGFDDYLQRLKPHRQGDAVAVVVAEGEIGDGEAPPGRIGGLSTAALIRKAREDVQVKALVLRVDSPGGSAFGAELIRRELELTRAAGKPVVVSMGDLAASGGYWVATAADEVMADAATVTGSIGVFTLLPTAEKALDKLGVHTGGVTTTWLGAAYDPRRAIDPRFAAVVQSSVDHTYADFIARVAAARKRSPAQIDAVAQGRVWTGAQALQRGLVDRLGSYRDALEVAAQRGKLPGADHADFRVTYLEREPGRLQQLLELIGSPVLEVLADQVRASAAAGGARAAARTGLAGRPVAAAPALRAGGALPVQRPLTPCCAPGVQATVRRLRICARTVARLTPCAARPRAHAVLRTARPAHVSRQASARGSRRSPAPTAARRPGACP